MSVCNMVVCFFFFKQKTAYEMRISDWSSDVCSSDLRMRLAHRLVFAGVAADARPVGHRDERLDMARLAIALQIGVRARQRPRQPRLVGVKALRPLVDAAIAVPRPARPDQKGEQHQQRKSPRTEEPPSELLSRMHISY